MENYESIDKALNISETDIVPTKKVSPPKEVSKINEIEKDYEYTRANLYSIIEKGQEAINGIMEVAAGPYAKGTLFISTVVPSEFRCLTSMLLNNVPKPIMVFLITS